MITGLDDYLVHQTTTPVAQPVSSDRNWYDRHYLQGIDPDNEMLFIVGFGLYPNRRVMDAHISFVVGDKQHSLHASRRAPHDRRETRVGPIVIEIVEPLACLRLVTDDNDEGISCDLTFTATSAPHREPDNMMLDDGHVVIHTCRYAQRGRWTGSYTIDGVTRTLESASGMRDRSWGIRPVGEPEAVGAPNIVNDNPGAFLLWASLELADDWFYYTCLEDALGRTVQSACDRIALTRSDSTPRSDQDTGMLRWEHRPQYVTGTRRASGAELLCQAPDGNDYKLQLETFGSPFLMRGVGYQHPQWGHAFWKGEIAVERETYDLSSVDPLDYTSLHVTQLCRVACGDRRGFGTLENLVIGKCEKYGFRDFLDGATQR